MPYNNETDLFHIPYPGSGQQSSVSEEQYRDKIPEWVMEALLRGLAGDDTDATISDGFAVSDNGGLSISVAAGRGFLDGIPIHSSGATTKSGLTDDDTSYIYLKLTATSDRDRTFTVEASLSGPPQADSILIATVTTSGGSITDIDNTPSGRAPRIPQTWGGIPQFRVVAPSGGDYTTVKAAVDAANAGDVIWVCAGTYTEAATILIGGDGLKIVGAGAEKTILNFTAADASDCIDLNGKDGIIIEDLTIQAVAGKTGVGIHGAACSDCRIEGVHVEAAGLVSLIKFDTSGARNKVIGCRIDQTHPTGIKYGIYFDSVTHCAVLDCDITFASSGECYAILFYPNAHDGMARGNRVSFTASGAISIGIYVRDSDAVFVRGNEVLALTTPGTWYGIFCVIGARDTIQNSVQGNIVLSVGSAGVGIGLTKIIGSNYLDNCIVEANHCSLLATGVNVGSANVRNALIHGNMCKGCTAAVSDSGTSTTSADNVGP